MRPKNEIRERLRNYQRRSGNWRLKGLLLSAFTDAETVGEAWPRTDRWLAEEHKQSPYRAMHTADDGGQGGTRNVVVPAERDGHEMAHAREEFSDRELNSEVPRDEYFRRMLLRGAEEELDTLWREELLTTVIEGAQVKEVARQAATVIDVDSKKGDYPRGEGAGYAQELSEGGRIEDDMEGYDTVAFDCTKYGAGFSVTDEMIDHAQIDAIERQVRFSGKRIENSLNRRYINQLVDNAGLSVDTDQATPTLSEVQGINHAVGEIEKADFPEPNYTVMHPDYKTAYFDEANISRANYAGSDSGLTQRAFDPIFGTEILTASSGVYDSGTESWEWDSNDDVGAVATNSEMIGIFMYQDISTKDFEDPIRDIRGGNARAWFDVQVLQPDAHCTLGY
jgi:hypothetical protein